MRTVLCSCALCMNSRYPLSKHRLWISTRATSTDKTKETARALYVIYARSAQLAAAGGIKASPKSVPQRPVALHATVVES